MCMSISKISSSYEGTTHVGLGPHHKDLVVTHLFNDFIFKYSYVARYWRRLGLQFWGETVQPIKVVNGEKPYVIPQNQKQNKDVYFYLFQYCVYVYTLYLCLYFCLAIYLSILFQQA